MAEENESVQIDTSSTKLPKDVDYLKVEEEEKEYIKPQQSSSPLKRMGDKIREVSTKAQELFAKVKERRLKALKERLESARETDRLFRGGTAKSEQKEAGVKKEEPSKKIEMVAPTVQQKVVPAQRTHNGIMKSAMGFGASGAKMGSRWSSRFS